MPAILFVCTANRCRSPMAAALFQRQLEAAGLASAWSVASAGTWTKEGYPADWKAVRVMAERGIDLQPHRSRSVSAEILAAADLIVVMTKDHREALCIEFPNLASRILLISEVGSPLRYDLPDPIAGSLDDVRATTREIADLFQAGFDVVVRRFARG